MIAGQSAKLKGRRKPVAIDEVFDDGTARVVTETLCVGRRSYRKYAMVRVDDLRVAR